MTNVNLNNSPTTVDDGKDSIVIVDNFQSIRGGRSLDVTGFLLPVIRAGHVIIKETSTGNHKPMPANGKSSIATLGTIVPGSLYTNGTYTAVPLTGGTGFGATATIVAASGAITTVTMVNKGQGYTAGDSLTANLGPTGSGFRVPVATVNANGIYGALPGGHEYVGVLVASILTAKPFAGIMVRGTINPVAAPNDFATIAASFKTAVPLIDQRAD